MGTDSERRCSGGALVVSRGFSRWLWWPVGTEEEQRAVELFSETKTGVGSGGFSGAVVPHTYGEETGRSYKQAPQICS